MRTCREELIATLEGSRPVESDVSFVTQSQRNVDEFFGYWSLCKVLVLCYFDSQAVDKIVQAFFCGWQVCINNNNIYFRHLYSFLAN